MFFASINLLIFGSMKTKRTVFEVNDVYRVMENSELIYTFTNSEKLKREEFFRVDGADDLVMTHTRYQSLGVGLPYSPAEGILTNTPDGKFILKMDRPYKTVKLRTAVQAKPRIIHKNKVYDLCDLYGQGTLVEIKAEKRYQYWLN